MQQARFVSDWVQFLDYGRTNLPMPATGGGGCVIGIVGSSSGSSRSSIGIGRSNLMMMMMRCSRISRLKIHRE